MSSEQAKKFHSITIGEKNTWDDWHLVPSSRPLINPPEVKTSYVELIGGDGFLDLTTSLTPKPTYENRTGSWEFFVINPGQLPSDTPFTDWTVLYSQIMAYLHGKKHTIILDDEPDYYYSGRLFVDSWRSSPGNSIITINYNVAPFKKKINGSKETF